MKNGYTIAITRFFSWGVVLILFVGILGWHTPLNSQCTHTIELTDTWGDGWNGGAVSVSVNGVTVLSNITFTSGFGPVSFNFSAAAGQTIRVWRTLAGSWPGEMRIRVLNSSGAVVINTVQPTTGSATSGGHTGTASCPPPPPAGTCAHTIELTDTWGDGWNGGAVSVSVNGVTVLNNITFSSGFGPVSFSFNAAAGQTVRVWRTLAGSWPGEMRIRVLNGSGGVVINTVQPTTGSATSGGHTGTAACPAASFNPCASIPNISGCGASVSTTWSSGQTGAWNPISNNCGWTTPGEERIWTFTPATSGIHQLNVTAISGGYVNLFFKQASSGCNNSGWTCIQDIIFTGTYGSINLTAGVQYYFMADPEHTNAGNMTFNVICPVPNPTSVTSSTPAICAGSGSNVTLTANGVSGTVHWFTGSCSTSGSFATGNSVVVSPATTTTYFARNFNGSTWSSSCASVTVTVNPLPTVNAGAGGSICNGSSLQLNASASGSTTPSVSWDNTGSLSNPSILNPVASPTSSTTYTVTATSNGCSASSQVTVTVNPIPATPVVSASGSTTICPGTQLTLNSTTGAGTVWSDGQTGAIAQVSAAGSYTATNIAAGCTSTVSNAIPVSLFPTPVVPVISAGGSITFCQGDSVILSSTGGTSTNWSQGASGSSLTVLTPGAYSATITDANGCISGISNLITITVNNLPSAPTISPSGNQAICLGNSLTVTASEPTGIQWSNGQSGTTQSFSIQGIYTANYTDGNGCTSPSSPPLDLTVNPLPIAPQIIASGPTVFCDGDSVVLVSSYTFGNSWTGGTSDTLLVVKQSGAFLVTHTDNNGCTSPNSTPVLVNVLALPTPPVISAAGQTIFCSGSQVTLSSDYSQGNTWSNGAQTASIQATQQDVYTAFFTDNNGCNSLPSNAISVTVNPTPVIQSLSLPVTCALSTAQLNQQSQVAGQNGAGIVQYDWLLGDGNMASGDSVAHQYAQPGAWQVVLQVTTNHGCQDTLSGFISVNPKPAINAILAADVCEGFVANFTQNTFLAPVNGAQLQTFSWSFGNGQTGSGAATSHLYAAPGAYAVQLVTESNHGCFDTAETTLLVNPAPQISSVQASTVCEGLVTDLSASAALSSVNGTQIASYNWSFGDGNVQNTAPSLTAHLYANPGSYTATVVVASSQGCLDSGQVTVAVNPKPVLSGLSIPQVCEGILSQGTVAVSVPQLNGAQLQSTVWSHGDGTNSPAPGLSHQYANAGNYSVQLVATTNQGCVDSIQGAALVNPLPQIGTLAAVTLCEGDAAAFTQSAQVAAINGAQLTQFDWSFGDGNSGSGTSASHTYLNEGLLTGQLQVTTNQGCTDVQTFPVAINPTPVIQSVSAPAVCEGTSASFAESIQYSGFNNGVVQSYNWISGDGSSYATQGPINHTYVAPGSYTVSLMIQTSHGCSDSMQVTQLVHENPVIQSNQVVPVCQGVSTQFSPVVLLSGVNGAIINDYIWDFGNGSGSTQATPGVVYAAPGTYTAELIVVTQYGCSDTSLLTAEVYHLPQPDFLIDTLCYGVEGTFLNTSQIADGSIQSYEWNFGDNAGFSNQQDPFYVFSAPGTYTVTLTATSGQGCANQIQLPVSISQGPNSSFSPILTAPFTLQFTPDSQLPGQTYLWDFGDGQTSTMAVPTHQYTQPGQFQVCLTVSDANCSSESCSSVQLNTTGTQLLDGLPSISLYPNPVTLGTRLSLTLNETQRVSWEILDISGRKLRVGTNGVLPSGVHELHLGPIFSDLPSGTYMLSVLTGNRTSGVRFVKIRELD